MKGKGACVTVAAVMLLLAACATAPIAIDRVELAAARMAIDQARLAKAEQCAPELLAKAVSRLYWAAHELSEDHESSDYVHETNNLIAQAEKYAISARETSKKNCKDITTVILMPDEDGKVGAVLLNTDSASQTINQAYHFSSVTGKSAEPEPVREMGEDEVRRRFSRLLKAQPPKPARYTLYFISGSSKLTEESMALIPEVIKAASERHPSEISVVGHSDATGSDKINMKISSARAEAVSQLLKASDPPPRSIYLRFHGENDPLIPTPDSTPEPRNRRVEITIL